MKHLGVVLKGRYLVTLSLVLALALVLLPLGLGIGGPILAQSPSPPLLSSGSDEITVDYEINPGLPWYYSETYSVEGYDAYLAGNSFSNQANVSNIAFTVTKPGVFSFDYRVSTHSSGGSYALYYNVNVAIDSSNYSSARNYSEYLSFRGVVDWTNVVFNISQEDLDEDGQAVVYIAYYRGGTSTSNDNMVALANVCFTSGEKTLTLDIEGGEYGYVTDGEYSYSYETSEIEYQAGDTVTLTAVPDTGCRFYGWIDGSGRFLSTDKTYSFMISANTTLKALFAPESNFAAHRNGEFYTETGGGLEQALIDAKSGDIIVMLENHTLSADATIPVGVKLYIPYSANFDEDGNADGVSTVGSLCQASTKIASPENTFRTLTIDDGITLTINGTVNIGSVIGYPSQHYQGHTSGWHGKITNNGEIVVNIGGILDCWGLITGSGSVTALSGSSVYEPFIVYDFAGGWNTAELYFADQSPFKQYAMQNIQNELTIDSGSTLYGRCNLWATSQYNKVDIVYVGEEGMYQLVEGASLVRTYDGGKYVSTNSDIGKVTYKFNGGMTLNYLSMPILGVAISTADVDFPLPYNLDIVLEDGNYFFAGRSKLMPGATLRVEEDATLTVNETLFVLDGLIQSDMSGKFYPTTGTLQTGGFSGSGQLIVNGALIVKEEAHFGGIVQTENGGENPAIITIEAGALVNCTDVQDGAVGEYDVNTSIFDLPARAYIYDSHKERYTLKRLYPDRSYKSYNAEQWELDSYSMTYAANCKEEEGDPDISKEDKYYHEWIIATVDLYETRIGSWSSVGEIYHNICVNNGTVNSDTDATRTVVSEGQLEDEIYEGGEIEFTVKTTGDGKGYVYRVFCTIGTDEPIEITPNEQGLYTISDVHDDVAITVTSSRLGDLNFDDKINMSDLLTLQRIIAGYITPTDWQRIVANTNRDPAGNINMSDLLQLQRYVAGYLTDL